MKRRLVCLLLVLVLCATALPVAAFAAVEVKEPGYVNIPVQWIREEKDRFEGEYTQAVIDNLYVERNRIGNAQVAMEEADVLILSSKNAYYLGDLVPLDMLVKSEVLKLLSDNEMALAVNTDQGGVVFPVEAVKTLASAGKDLNLKVDGGQAEGIAVETDGAAVKALVFARKMLENGTYDGYTASYFAEASIGGAQTVVKYAAESETVGLSLEQLLQVVEQAGFLTVATGQWDYPWAEAAKGYDAANGKDNVDAATLKAVLEAVYASLGDQVPEYFKWRMKDWLKWQISDLGRFRDATGEEIAAIAREYTNLLLEFLHEDKSPLLKEAIYPLGQSDIRYKQGYYR